LEIIVSVCSWRENGGIPTLIQDVGVAQLDTNTLKGVYFEISQFFQRNARLYPE
jgi:hypothetical protein